MVLPDAVFARMAQRNEQGQAFEKAGQVEDAIPLYEANVAEGFYGTFPYDRLRIIYTRMGRLEDAIRVCEVFMRFPVDPHVLKPAQPRFKHHRDKLRGRLEKDEI